MKKIILFSAITIATSMGAFGQNVNIPDANFKAYLVGETNINTNADTEIQVSEAIAFTGSISCGSLGINDLTGVEAFVNLTGLLCSNNNLSAIDISSCTNLESLTVDFNSLTALDISQNTNLTFVNCNDNGLTTLDISANAALEALNFSNTNISSIDLSSNANLLALICSGNNISALDVSVCPTLAQLISMNSNLTQLNLQNISTTAFLNVTGNPNLTCIEVDDVAAATSAWTNIDATASFSLDCSGLGVDDVVLNETVEIFPNPSSTQLSIDVKNKIISTSIIDAMGRTIPANLNTNNTVDVSNLSNGVYFLQIETDKGFATKKFIKE